VEEDFNVILRKLDRGALVVADFAQSTLADQCWLFPNWPKYSYWA